MPGPEELTMTIAAQVGPGERVLGVGIDTAVVEETAAAAERFGASYLRRVCTAQEAARLPAEPGHRAERLSRLWAAKEAATKTLAPSDATPWPWPEVEVLTEAAVTDVRLHGHPARLAQARGIRRVVVLEAGRDGQARGSASDEPAATVTVLAIALGDSPHLDQENHAP